MRDAGLAHFRNRSVELFQKKTPKDCAAMGVARVYTPKDFELIRLCRIVTWADP